MKGRPHIAIVGGGPAGLRAAEVCAEGGAKVSVFEQKRSVGRKLLVAGYGGLNLTHGEDLETFVTRYSGPGLPGGFARMIREFPPAKLRPWAAGLGIETFEQRTGRVYPREMKAAPLLRRWIERLRRQGVEFHVNHRLTALQPGPKACFNDNDPLEFDAMILAMGGGSWPQTGSDAAWIPVLESCGISISPLQPANCGWEAGWPTSLTSRIEGQPLKNIAASCGGESVRGEIMLTRYGVEGGAVYQLGPALRKATPATLTIDLKPEVPLPILLRKMESVRKDIVESARERLRIPDAGALLLEHHHGPFNDSASLCRAVKSLRIPLLRPRPIAEAISSAGGIAWKELDEQLMLRHLPGVHACGEMVDWEAPTGGYLIQACFATATHAARSALRYRGQR
ncbi:NAD(P)/FAD-dependent oxidoreductase [Haloferula sp. A504]|uniref:NAD(P)/FAD-dependent oxidoreductase n=1 Tax=Haloferula sp. A504 TaxID=3373601 RepID=UPI0031BE3222|nr:TIGR03862 family flavoprotein [Verrucomicrobiaceae bacterium E54]